MDQDIFIKTKRHNQLQTPSKAAKTDKFGKIYIKSKPITKIPQTREFPLHQHTQNMRNPHIPWALGTIQQYYHKKHIALIASKFKKDICLYAYLAEKLSKGKAGGFYIKSAQRVISRKISKSIYL